MLMKKVMLAACLCVATALMCGCAAQERVLTLHTTFDEAQARAAMGPGTNTVKGQAFLRQNGGGVVTCAGETVYLAPATRYAEERITLLYGSPDGGFVSTSDTFRFRWTPETPESYHALQHTCIADAQGNFRFEGVRDGAYYLVTRVIWTFGNNRFHGGAMARKVSVSGGRTEDVILTR